MIFTKDLKLILNEYLRWERFFTVSPSSICWSDKTKNRLRDNLFKCEKNIDNAQWEALSMHCSQKETDPKESAQTKNVRAFPISDDKM